MKIALWRSMDAYPSTCIFGHIPADGFTRISEYVEVEFPPRDAKDLAHDELSAILARAEAARKEGQELSQKASALIAEAQL